MTWAVFLFTKATRWWAERERVESLSFCFLQVIESTPPCEDFCFFFWAKDQGQRIKAKAPFPNLFGLDQGLSACGPRAWW